MLEHLKQKDRGRDAFQVWDKSTSRPRVSRPMKLTPKKAASCALLRKLKLSSYLEKLRGGSSV
jgi:hypothetical protein